MGVVVRRWGDLYAMLGQHVADRLDTSAQPAIATVVVVPLKRDCPFCGRSSSAAKKAEAAISFARRSLVFSRLSRLLSAAASVLTRGVRPSRPGCGGTRSGSSPAPDPEHLRHRGHSHVLARIVRPELGNHSDSALMKLARLLAGKCP